MREIEKSKSIRADLQKGFREGTSKMAQRRCCGYVTTRTASWSLNWIRQPSPVGFSTVTSAATAWAGSPEGWRNRASHHLRVSSSGTGKVSTNCCPTRSIRGGYSSRKPLMLADPKSKTMASWIDISTPIPMKPLFLMRHLKQRSKRNSTVPNVRKANTLRKYYFDSI